MVLAELDILASFLWIIIGKFFEFLHVSGFNFTSMKVFIL